MSGAVGFSIAARCGAARAGTLGVRGRTVDTPAFLPVGTYGAVKGVPPSMLEEIGSHMLLANACHLHDRPGEQAVAALGGLHRFMGWDGLLLTDSGGFQVFSMLDVAKLDDQGVTFRSTIDGRDLRLGPREAVDIQLALDADIAMTFDHCPPLPSDDKLLRLAMERTSRWAAIARRRHDERSTAGQALFGIVQGGLDDALRAASAEAIVAVGFDGYAIGGLSVGEDRPALQAAMHRYAPLLPEDEPRYVMGIGRPADVLEAIDAGFDLFDSVLPTRNGRHGHVWTPEGTLNMRNRKHREAAEPIEAGCDCPACHRWSRGAIRHLVLAGDPLGRMLCATHNLRYLHRLVARARTAIVDGTLDVLRADLTV